MNAVGNFLTNLESQWGSAVVVGLLLGLAALLGLILGMSLMGIIAAAARRRRVRALREENDLLQDLLGDARHHGVRLQAEHDTLRSKYNGVEAYASRQDDRVSELGAEIDHLKMASIDREQEILDQNAARLEAQAVEPPMLNKRVSAGAVRPARTPARTPDTGIIPDDQVIPTLPEAELTANIEAFDLEDLEDLVDRQGQ